jgi:hypothetical protein
VLSAFCSHAVSAVLHTAGDITDDRRFCYEVKFKVLVLVLILVEFKILALVLILVEFNVLTLVLILVEFKVLVLVLILVEFKVLTLVLILVEFKVLVLVLILVEYYSYDLLCCWSHGSSVGIVTRLRAGSWGFKSQQRSDRLGTYPAYPTSH